MGVGYIDDMIGILAIQGGFEEHERVLDELGLAHKRVTSLADTGGLTGLVIPGGESTVMELFMEKYGLKEWLVERVKADSDFVVLGTCAGLILLARYGLLDVTVERNAYGRQLASFTADLEVHGVGQVSGHFIRAPKITGVASTVQVLAEWDGTPVVVRQGCVWGISFHPELAGSSRLHAAIFSC
jgi:5'-phosphate synthase pdxT subunit